MKPEDIARILKEEISSLTKDLSEQELDEIAPPGREKQVKTLKHALPKSYTDPKTGERKESNPYAIAWAQHNKKESLERMISSILHEEIIKLGLK